jgi:nitrite reductase/ring-hydroxylating ferredoxin subunit
MQDMNRRELIAAAATACACAFCPEVTALGAGAGTAAPIAVGTLKDFAKEAAYDKWVARGIVVIRQKDRVYATTSTCTHQGGRLGVQGALLACPRHGSQFKLTGEVAKGPAQRVLDRFAISVNKDGKIMVDTSKKFAQDKWDDAAAYVKVV